MPGALGGALSGIGITGNNNYSGGGGSYSGGSGNSGNGWVSDSLDALPGILGGTSQLIYAIKGTNQAPTYYVTQDAPATGSKLVIFGVVGLAVLILLILLMKGSGKS